MNSACAQALDHLVELFPAQRPRVHGKEGRGRGLGQFHEVFPAVGIVFGLPDDALHFFVVDVAVKAAHAMAFDEGDHVVFETSQVVGRRRHLFLHCMPEFECSYCRLVVWSLG